MNKIKQVILFCSVLLLASCSTQKNTALTRSFHATKTKYNILFNGKNSFDEGLKKIDEANTDDYTQIIPLYPVSNHEAAKAAESEMNRTIEKCRKCIKLHSIKVKPKPNPKKKSDPKYRAFLQQEEFNREMHKAWMLLGQAEFHKADFLGSVGTFNYISKHYQHNKDIVAQCELWKVRAYAEMGWIYEAEDILQKVNQDDLSRKYAALYASTSADLKLKQEQYTDALPFLKITLNDQKKTERTRTLFILAQISEQQGQIDKATTYYKRVLRQNLNPEMEFTTRLHLATLSGNTRSLSKLAKLSKNKDRLDQIYGAIGAIYLNKKDTARALENFELAIEKSTLNQMPKGRVLLNTADIYFSKQQYAKAQPHYAEAQTIFSADAPEYKRIQQRAEVLGELVAELSTVELQDSLQRLSKLTEEEQLAVAKKVIAELEEQERIAAEKAAQAAREAELAADGPVGINTQNMIGMNSGKGDWYFYNQNLMRSGKQEFSRRWGNRSLEDNWRRRVKQAYSNFQDDTDLAATDSLSNNTTDSATTVQPLSTDPKDPQYYIQQIPKTEADIAASDSLIADALYAMIDTYRRGLEDNPKAEETANEFMRRFPKDPRGADIIFGQYLNCLRYQLGCENQYRQQLIANYPQSQQAIIAADPQYFEKYALMQAEQDSLYEATYNAYLQADWAQVKSNKEYAETNFIDSKHTPQLLFLNAIAIAKSESQDHFVSALQDLVSRYPSHPVGAQAKDMLAMMNQGMEAEQGSAGNGLIASRQEIIAQEDSTDTADSFSTERAERAVCILLIEPQDEALNQLLYRVALFNFSQFLIKDFDLQALPLMPIAGKTNYSALIISGLESLDEALWYENMLRQDTDLMQTINSYNAQIICITEPNLALLKKYFTLDDYSLFLLQSTTKR